MSMATAVRSFVAKATMGPHDVRALLQKDHKEALELAKQMHAAKAASRRKTLLGKLKPALVAHSRAEEAQVYNALLKVKKSQKSHDIGNEGYVEHSLLDELLKRLASNRADSDAWKAEAKVLYELLEHHVEEEQSDMFSDLGRHFTADELAAMGRRFTQAKLLILAKAKAKTKAR
jgi:hypothetical protein